MRLAAGLFFTLGLAAFSDVMPHCGGPKVEIREPGQECGHQGPRWRGDCREPAICYRLEKGGATCTRPCAADGDCASLGAGFSCAGEGKRYDQPNAESSEKVCAQR